MGVSVTRTVKYIPAAQKGERGAGMRGPQYWTDVPEGFDFHAGETGEREYDVIIYNDQFYECAKPHTKTSTNYPGSTTDVNNGLWRLGDKVSLCAANLFLAAYALIKNLGAEAIEMKNSAGEIVFKAKDGNITCKTGNFENVSVTGDLVVNRLRYLANQRIPNTSTLNCSFIRGGGYYVLPSVAEGEYMRVTVFNPQLTRTIIPARLEGSGNNDKFVMGNGDFFTDAVSSVSLTGWYELIGIHDVDRTVWMVQEVRKY